MKNTGEIAEIKDESYGSRFKMKDDYCYGLFYPVEDPKKTEYRPYNDVNEMIDHFCSHFNLVLSTYSLPHIWVKGKPESKYKDEIVQVVGFYNKISQKNTQSLAGYMNGFKILLY